MTARIGVAKRIHVIVDWQFIGGGWIWGVSACGWAGRAIPAKDGYWCQKCKRRP